MRITLSVMVESVAACGDPLEQLLKLLESYEIKATFFVATGVDDSLPFSKRIASKGRIESAATSLLAIRQSGHDVGMSSHRPLRWLSDVAHADDVWVMDQWQRSMHAWSELYGTSPAMHAATGFQVHPQLFQCEAEAGLSFASDTRGQTPFYPAMQQACAQILQLPVTVASAEEMLRISPGCVNHLHEELFDASIKLLPQGQHWRIMAGRDELQLVEKLIVMWRGTSKEFMTLGQVAEAFAATDKVLHHQVGWQEIAGRYLAMQSLPLEKQ